MLSPPYYIIMKILGLLGGTAYPSTALYYTTINDYVQKKLGGASSAELVLWSFNHAITSAGVSKGDFSLIRKEFPVAANKLKSIGAEAIVICANTMHGAAPDISAAVGIPVLHVVDAVGERLKRDGVKKVGMLATKAVCDGDFYVPLLRQNHGIDIVLPTESENMDVNTIVFKELSNGIIKQESSERLKLILKGMVEKGAECVLLACTDLAPLLERYDAGVPILDSTIIHAEHVAEWALS